jgi:Pvc16 N-terminal domain
VQSWSTPDISDITQVVKGLLENAVSTSTLPAGNIKVDCDSPDVERQSDGFCHLNIYLLHVARDPYWRNTPVSGPRPQLTKAQPLSLTLSYLLTAWCDKDYVSEQRAMTIALQAIHGVPIVTQNVINANLLQAWLPSGEFVMSIEADTIDEMSRLWQAFTVPIRLSALIKVGIVFIAPEAPQPPVAIPPSTTNLTVTPEPLQASAAQLLPGASSISPPVTDGTSPNAVTSSFGPLAGGANGTLIVGGNGLDLPSAAQVFLSRPGGPEWQVTAWRESPTDAGLLWLKLPGAYADPATQLPAPPTAVPLPGLYNLTVGSGATRSNAISVLIVPEIDGVTQPPVLAPDSSGLYTINGAGFVPAATAVSFGATPLTASGGTPAAGQFNVNAAGTVVQLRAPAALPAGSYPIVVSVNGCQASTGWVAVL